jgi:hypothetical protein
VTGQRPRGLARLACPLGDPGRGRPIQVGDADDGHGGLAELGGLSAVVKSHLSFEERGIVSALNSLPSPPAARGPCWVCRPRTCDGRPFAEGVTAGLRRRGLTGGVRRGRVAELLLCDRPHAVCSNPGIAETDRKCGRILT